MNGYSELDYLEARANELSRKGKLTHDERNELLKTIRLIDALVDESLNSRGGKY